ncbi:MAG: hypothetical protein M9915_12940 [Rhizobacter sp.]|nr:hypothetical protein [Rhizobacter sp.]
MLMLTDTDPEFDLRVLDAWRKHNQPELIVVSSKSTRPQRLLSSALSALLMLRLMFTDTRGLARISQRLGNNTGRPWAGLRAQIKLQAAAIAFFWRHRSRLKAAQSIYAHDQLCGAVAWMAHRFYGVAYDYDAHEIVPFRARRTSLLRVMLEFSWERRIIRGCRVCYVVNKPMRRLYRHFYGTANYVIRPNAFFVEQEIDLRADGDRLIVYVGSTGTYRRLETLVSTAKANNAEPVLFCENARQVGASLGVTDCHELSGYAPKLVEVAGGTASYFWCSFDGAILSYRYSLPNKFFQAVAMGIPIIATRGTYLGKLVAKYGFGYTIDERSSACGLMWDRAQYKAALEAMRWFRGEMRDAKIVL